MINEGYIAKFLTREWAIKILQLQTEFQKALNYSHRCSKRLLQYKIINILFITVIPCFKSIYNEPGKRSFISSNWLKMQDELYQTIHLVYYIVFQQNLNRSPCFDYITLQTYCISSSPRVVINFNGYIIVQ